MRSVESVNQLSWKHWGYSCVLNTKKNYLFQRAICQGSRRSLWMDIQWQQAQNPTPPGWEAVDCASSLSSSCRLRSRRSQRHFQSPTISLLMRLKIAAFYNFLKLFFRPIFSSFHRRCVFFLIVNSPCKIYFKIIDNCRVISIARFV